MPGNLKKHHQTLLEELDTECGHKPKVVEALLAIKKIVDNCSKPYHVIHEAGATIKTFKTMEECKKFIGKDSVANVHIEFLCVNGDLLRINDQINKDMNVIDSDAPSIENFKRLCD